MGVRDEWVERKLTTIADVPASIRPRESRQNAYLKSRPRYGNMPQVPCWLRAK